jgi:hypothetical protein
MIGRVPGDIVTRLSSVDVGRGSEALYRDQMPGLLHLLADRARVASITASSAIEGIVVPDRSRAERILQGRAGRLRSRSEQELAGYRDAQDYLFVRFRPVPAKETEFHVAELVDRYTGAVSDGQHHPVLLIGSFVLDLLVIHPFEDGNGRVARAMTNALLIDRGYTASRYVSLEALIVDSEDAYYQALLDSTHGWHEDKAAPWPWLRYFVGLLADAYDVFSTRAAASRSGGSKQDRVRDYVLNHAPDEFRIADVRGALPGISDQTIRLVLDRLRFEGVAIPQGKGRTATWRRTSRR